MISSGLYGILKAGGLRPLLRKHLAILGGIVVCVVVAAWLLHEPTKTIGGLSQRDLRQIRSLVRSDVVPARLFGWKNVRLWPALIRARWSLEIKAIAQESSPGQPKIYTDGAEAKSSLPMWVLYKAYGSPEAVSALVRTNGHWHIVDSSRRRSFVILDSGRAMPPNAPGNPVYRQIAPLQPQPR